MYRDGMDGPDWFYSTSTACRDCEQKELTLDHISDHLQGVIHQLYSQDILDIDLLEFNLGEICHVLKIKLPAEMPNIERKRPPRSAIFDFAAELSKKQVINS